MTSYFSQGSTDAIIADGLRDGDVVLINRPCLSLGDPISMALCLASKYGLSGEGRQCWDHAAIVVRDRGVPYLLEGNSGGVTMRTYEERLLQSHDHQEVTVLPLRTAAAASSSARQGEDQRRATAFSRFVDELGLRRTSDGFDSTGEARCRNTWAAYRALRQPQSKRGLAAAAAAATPSAAESGACCRFGAPLVATALQRLGALDARVDPAAVTPAALPTLPLAEPSLFGRPVAVRNLN